MAVVIFTTLIQILQIRWYFAKQVKPIIIKQTEICISNLTFAEFHRFSSDIGSSYL